MVYAAPAMALAGPGSLLALVSYFPPSLDGSATLLQLRCHYMPMVRQEHWALCVIFAIIDKSLFMGCSRGQRYFACKGVTSIRVFKSKGTQI